MQVCVFMFECKIHITENRITSQKELEEGKWKHQGKDNGPKPFKVLCFPKSPYLRYTYFVFEVMT